MGLHGGCRLWETGVGKKKKRRGNKGKERRENNRSEDKVGDGVWVFPIWIALGRVG